MILQVAKRIANIRFDCIKNGIHQEVTGQLKAVVTDKWGYYVRYAVQRHGHRYWMIRS